MTAKRLPRGIANSRAGKVGAFIPKTKELPKTKTHADSPAKPPTSAKYPKNRGSDIPRKRRNSDFNFSFKKFLRQPFSRLCQTIGVQRTRAALARVAVRWKRLG